MAARLLGCRQMLSKERKGSMHAGGVGNGGLVAGDVGERGSEVLDAGPIHAIKASTAVL